MVGGVYTVNLDEFHDLKLEMKRLIGDNEVMKADIREMKERQGKMLIVPS